VDDELQRWTFDDTAAEVSGLKQYIYLRTHRIIYMAHTQWGLVRRASGIKQYSQCGYGHIHWRFNCLHER